MKRIITTADRKDTKYNSILSAFLSSLLTNIILIIFTTILLFSLFSFKVLVDPELVGGPPPPMKHNKAVQNVTKP